MKELKRINSIDQEILDLKLKIRELEKEKQTILQELYGSESTLIGMLPARARNALLDLGIDTDLKLKYFLHGEGIKFIDPHSILKYYYPYAKTAMARLQCLHNVGSGAATEAIKILQQHSDILPSDDTE